MLNKNMLNKNMVDKIYYIFGKNMINKCTSD